MVFGFRFVRRATAGGALALSLAVPAGLSAQNTTTVTFENANYMGECRWGGGNQIVSSGGFSFGGLVSLDLLNYENQCGRNFNTGYAKLPYSNGNEVIALGSTPAYLNRNSAFVLKSLVAGAGWINTTDLTLSFYLNTVWQGETKLSLDVFQDGKKPFTDLFAGAADFIRFPPRYVGNDIFDSYDESCVGAGEGCTKARYETFFLDNLVFEDASAPVVVPPVVTPEPSTIGLMALGMLAIAGVARKRRKR